MAGPEDRSPDAFNTVEDRGEATIEVRGSTFIGHVTRVDDVAAAESFIEAVTAANADATHNVPAYRIRQGDGQGDLLREWSSDAGEPAGSAGKPVLTVLVNRDLENIAAVVTRHFGGTELGVGGLARSYRRAVSAAIDNTGVVVTRPHRQFTIEVEYDDSGTVRGVLESTDVEFDAEYGTSARFDVRVPRDEAEALLDRLRSATSGRARIDETS